MRANRCGAEIGAETAGLPVLPSEDYEVYIDFFHHCVRGMHPGRVWSY